ncbi:MAG TPA: HAD family hydrolase [Myxococcota bacterium]|nr:HAD family hydrolase [Myxococcota bacterium]
MSTVSDARAWLVDLDGTLYHAAPVKAAMALELVAAGLRVAPLLRRFRAEHERVRALDGAGSDPFARQLAGAALALGVEPATLLGVVDDWMFRRPGKWLRAARRRSFLAELAAFRAAGGRTALVSDYPARQKLTALGVGALFETVVASGEPGGPRRLKPSPEGVLAAAARLGVRPAECLVIGDREDADGEAARRAGMRFRRISGL